MEEAFTFNYIKKIECTGCEACANICPVGAMEMRKDESGFSIHIQIIRNVLHVENVLVYAIGQKISRRIT